MKYTIDHSAKKSSCCSEELGMELEHVQKTTELEATCLAAHPPTWYFFLHNSIFGDVLASQVLASWMQFELEKELLYT